MFKARSVSLLLIVTLSMEANAAFMCRSLFGMTKKKEVVALSQIETKTSYESFIEIKEEMISKIRSKQNLDEALWQKPDSKLAFLQAVGETSNWDILNIQSLVEQRDSKSFKKVNKLVSKMEFDKGVGKYQFRNQLNQLYTLLNPAPQSIFKTPTQNREKLIDQRIEKAFLENSMEKAVVDLGLVKSSRDISKFKEFRHKHRKFERAALATFINVATMDVIGGAMDLTSTLIPQKKIPDLLIERIYDEGIDSVKEDVSAYLSKSARREVRWNYIKGSIQTFTYGVVLYYLTTLYPYAKIGYEAMTSTPEKLEQVQKESFNAAEIKKELIQNWKDSFYELEGRYPDMNNPKDKAEYETEMKSINNLKDEDLIVNFKEL